MASQQTPEDKWAFHCTHCNGRILIPRDLPPTTGPCPYCGEVITSPPPVPDSPPALPAGAATPPMEPSVMPRTPIIPHVDHPVSAMPALPPGPVNHASPAVPQPPESAPEPAHAGQGGTDKPPAARKSPAAARAGKSTAAGHRRSSRVLPVGLAMLGSLAVLGGAFYFLSQQRPRPASSPAIPAAHLNPAAQEQAYLQSGWKKDAYEVLRGFMAAAPSQAKLPFILRGEELAPRVEAFYGGVAKDESNLSAEAFKVFDLTEADHQRGLFLLVYEQSSQTAGPTPPDARITDPLRVQAFFKRTPEGLKLDWETYVQTKFRTLRKFVAQPEVGQSAIFRVFVVEDVPAKGALISGARTYKVADPANVGDTATVSVRSDSEAGRELLPINWRGMKDGRPITRTATVELAWSGDEAKPELSISRFICWEFLGLGGQAGAK